MSPRRRRLIVALAVVAGLLFAGRWTAVTLAGRWWGAQFSPAAASFLTDLQLLRLILDMAAVLVASAWFIGHLLIIYRAISSIHVPRHVANVEFREALTPRVLLGGIVLSGAVLGLVIGAGASAWWPTIVLAWHGVPHGVVEPLLGYDLGLYVAQLPLWRLLHGFALLLVALALLGVLTLYTVVGAVHWIDRRPAISDYARAHVGWLLVALALCFAWGYLLEPYELVAGIARASDAGSVHTAFIVAPALVGIALMVALVSGIWAVQPRHALIVAGWAVLALASVTGHYVLPTMGATGEPPVEVWTRQRIEGVAFGLDRVRDSARAPRAGPPRRPAPLSVWHAAAIAGLPVGDSSTTLAVNPAVLSVSGQRRAVWLSVRGAPAGRAWIAAIADDRTSPSGAPMYYRPGDTLPYPTPFPLVEISGGAVRPDAPEYQIGSGAGGVPASGWFRRGVLAWALQGSSLFGPVRRGARVHWHLTPDRRLSRLAPFAEWSAPVARLIDGELVWLSDGYVASSSFPIASRLSWRKREVSALRAGFLGVVHAEDGATKVYLRADPGALAVAWAEIAAGVVEPASSIPPAVARAVPYPVEQFRVQAMALERPPWGTGALIGRPGPNEEQPFRHEIAWERDTSGAMLVAAYELSEERRLKTLVTASMVEGREALTLLRIDSAVTPLPPAAQMHEWSQFATFGQIRDSVQQSGARMEAGPFRFWLAPGTIGGYQIQFGRRPGGEISVAWVSLAIGRRVGAGRTFDEAWENLQGTSVPAPPAAGSTGVREPLAEARQWLRRAEAALHAGDFAAFGRAFNALKQLLEQSPEPGS